MDDTVLRDSLLTFIRTRFLKGAAAEQLTVATPLVSSGLLDSLAITETLMFLEDATNLSFDAQEIESGFETIESIVRLVSRKSANLPPS